MCFWFPTKQALRAHVFARGEGSPLVLVFFLRSRLGCRPPNSAGLMSEEERLGSGHGP